MDPLKLVALDKDDLEVVATHLQDAFVSVRDIIWLPTQQRLVLGLNRFDWCASECDHPQFRRCRAALRFERVGSCKTRNVSATDGVLNLLTIDFHETDPPSGTVILTFSGDAALRLEVECLEAELADLGPAWNTSWRPQHAADSADSRG